MAGTALASTASRGDVARQASTRRPSAPPSGGKPVGSADGKMPAQPSDGKTAGGQPAAKAEKTEVVEPLPKEDMKDLLAELDG